MSTLPWVEKLHAELVSIFRADPEVDLISTDLDAPFVDDQKSEPGTEANEKDRGHVT